MEQKKILKEFDLCIANSKSGMAEILIGEGGTSAILIHNGIKWNYLNFVTLKEANELYSSFDLAYGDVLISGLGFGVMLKMLEKKKSVKTITVLEFSQDIIDLYLANNTVSSKTKIICTNASTYKDDKHYDGVFLDHYEDQVFEWKINDINSIYKNIKCDNFWIWALEGMFCDWLIGNGILPPSNENRMDYMKLTNDFEKYWPGYATSIFPEIPFFGSIDLKLVHKYVKMFYTPSIQKFNYDG